MKLRRMMTGMVAACLMAATVAITASAVEPSYNVSDAYKDTKYYNNLLAYELTGDGVTDVIAIALSQMGYHEGNKNADMDGSSSGSKNFVEYNVLFGKLDNGEGNGTSYGYAWCAAFVNWCLRQARVDKELTGGMYVSCNSWRNWFINEGAKFGAEYHNRTDDYTPRPGDLIFYRSLSATHSRATDHIGIVLKSEDGKVYAIEGNADNRVGLHEYALTDKYIVGYGTPAYERAEVPTVDYYATDDYQPGYYISGTGVIAAYKGPDSSTGKVTNLPVCGVQRVDCVQGKYGRVTLEDGSHAWVALKRFTPMTADESYLVEIVAGEQSVKALVAKGSSWTVPEIEMEGTLLGWSQSESGEGDLIAAGQQITPEADIVLYPVMEQITTEEPTTEQLTQETTDEQPDEQTTAQQSEQQASDSCANVIGGGVVMLVLIGAAFVGAKKRHS